MKPGIPWSVKGIEPEVREAAKHAARRAGMTLGEWLNTVILDQNDQGQAEFRMPAEEIVQVPEPAPVRRPEPQLRRPEPSRRDDSSLRLEDIAQQLSKLAQRERESATIQAYETHQPAPAEQAALDRILDRIDNTERQAVEAFTAVNERLSVLGRQIAMAVKPKSLENPEDVPGFSALEGAIRNVVEHIEVSEKRTRDSLKSMQDRMAEMAERATRPSNPDDLLRAAPAFSSLETRLSDMANRIQRSENLLHTGMPDAVRKEMGALAERIESVKTSAESMVQQAQTSAAGVARHELRDIETRILGILKEAQSTIGSQQSMVADVQRLRGEIGGLNKRIDDVKSQTATDRDVHALRVAVEQLSTRVAQGPDTRPLADMDRRLGDLNRKLEQNTAAARNMPQFGELERRIAELDHRLGEAMRLQGDHQAIENLEQHIAAVNDRVARTEEQLGHLETMERAIHQLYDSLETNRNHASQTAEDAANRAVERFMAAQASAGPSPELRAMEEGLRAVRESATHAEQRNQEMLEAVHETLEQIVNKLAELETSSAGHQLAANLAQQAAQPEVRQHSYQPEPQPATSSQFFDPTGTFEQQVFTAPAAPQPQQAQPPQHAQAQASAFPADVFAEEPQAQQAGVPNFAAATADGIGSGDDFIAAARRAAQAAATRPSTLRAEPKEASPAASKEKRGFSIPFLKKSEKLPEPITFVNGKPVVERRGAVSADSKRKKLVLAGIVLLAAVSAFAFNMLAKPKSPAKQTSAIEVPLTVAPAMPQIASAPQKAAPPRIDYALNTAQTGLADVPASDPLVTGSLPARKTDATLTSIVAQPGAARAEMPPAETGTNALREAAARGDAKAQFIIASRYLDGQGVSQDLTKAAYWYQQSASRGLAPAQYRLGTLFERGKGVPQDQATALLWYERAAEGGNVKAMHNAAVIAAGNQAGTPNYDKAFRWFKAAAERGLHDSEFNLAVLHERGLGTRVDTQEAYFWYTLAAKQGDDDASKRAAGIASSLTGEQVAAVNSRSQNWQPLPTGDEGNVVAIVDPVWNDPAPQTAAAPSMFTPDATAPMMGEQDQAANPVAEAQSLLTKLGFNVGTPDGKLGSRTTNAIRLFQLQSGLKVTGEVTPEVLDAMRAKAG